MPGLFLERLRRLHAPLVRPGYGLRECRAGRPHPPVHPRWGRKVFRVAGRSGACRCRVFALPQALAVVRRPVAAGACRSCAFRPPRMLAAAQGNRGQRRVRVGILRARRIAVSTPPSPCLRFRVRVAGRKAWLFRAICCVRGQKMREMCNGGMVRLIVRAKLGSRCWFRDRFRRIGSRILPRLVPYQCNARFFVHHAAFCQA